MEQLSLNKRIDLAIEQNKSDPFRRAQEMKKLLKEAEKAADLFLIGKVNMLLANCILGQGRRDKILAYSFKAVSIFENMKDRAYLARSYNLLGIAYAGLGYYQRAVRSYNSALKVMHGKDYPGIQRDVMMNNIGDAYFEMGVYQKSLQIAIDCYHACRKKFPASFARITVYGMNVWNNYFAMGKYQEAKETLDGLQGDVSRVPKSPYVSGYHARLAIVLYALGDPEGGAKNTDIVLDLVRSNHDSYEFHPILEKITAFQIAQGDYDRVRQIAEILSKYAEECGYTLDRIIAKRVQANLCYALGEKSNALALFKELNLLYEEQTREQRQIQYESQKSVEDASKEIGRLMDRIRYSEEMAERDPLTGLMNRSALVNVTNEFAQEARANGKRLGGIFFDIDYFKEYNDTYGHASGDEAIKFIAKLCLQEEKRFIRFFRYGGDEFFGIVLNQRNKELDALALRISERVRAAGIAHEKNPNGQRLTVSIGIVNVNLKYSDDTVLDIIKYADKALYHAKDRGKDDVFAYHALPGAGGYEFRRVTQKSE